MYKLGNNNIKDVRIGDTKVKKVYIGNNIVWDRLESDCILNIPFQNSIADISGINTMIAGNGSNSPTFALSGRKAGEYCAVFNGSQSIKTTANLPLNSDKVSIAFWMKTTQTGAAIVMELSPNINSFSGFYITINEDANKLWLNDRNDGNNIAVSTENVVTGNWVHVVGTIDRSQDNLTQNQIYINGILRRTLISGNTTDNNGNFINNILFIGQRAGSSVGFNGSLQDLKIYNRALTATEVQEIYNSEL